MEKLFEAVTVEQLRARLGKQCSPDRSRHGYVIGPLLVKGSPRYGVIAHLASCHDINAARARADAYNIINSVGLAELNNNDN